MTVSTEYFDYVFESKDEVAEELDIASRKLARLIRKQARLERLVANRPSDKRLARLDKVTGLVDSFEEEVDLLSEELSDLNAVELPKDEITYEIWEPTDGFTGIKVTITDSPYDDTFVGGQKSSLFISGEKIKAKGGRSRFGTHIGLIGEDFEDGTDTFAWASSMTRLDGTYPDVTVGLVQGWTPKDPLTERPAATCVDVVFEDGVLQI